MSNRTRILCLDTDGLCSCRSHGSAQAGLWSTHAFIAGATGVGMAHLNSLVDLPAEVVLANAADINNRGQVIASASIVPEPASYALMLGGLALRGAITRRKQMTIHPRRRCSKLLLSAFPSDKAGICLVIKEADKHPIHYSP